tara:strand:- start:201 stop:377 length:177 start_codon:yes stop_codon:yes gene_type:complete
MREIEEIEDDLQGYQEAYDESCAEVCFHEMNRDDHKHYVDEYTKELRETKFKLGILFL